MSQKKISVAEAAMMLELKPQSLRNRMSDKRKATPRAYKDPFGRVFFYEEEVADWKRKHTKMKF